MSLNDKAQALTKFNDGIESIDKVLFREENVKKFIEECINDFYGNGKYKNEIRTPIEARDILIKRAGNELCVLATDSAVGGKKSNIDEAMDDLNSREEVEEEE